MVPVAQEAAEVLRGHGVDCGVAHARFAKPLDAELLLRVARETRGIVTVEENVRAGGFGEAVLDLLADHGLADRYLGCLSMPDSIVDHGPQGTMRKLHQVDATGIAARTREWLAERSTPPSDRAFASA
jgi:1-deoxy-D-xylulose-5-phosphate synthase